MDPASMITGTAAAGLLVLLIHFTIGHRLAGVLATKPMLSLLFIIVAWRQPTAYPVYAWLLIGALSVCWIGDACLIFPVPGMFLAGLFFFLTAHLIYTVAYLHLAPINAWSAAGAIAATLMVIGVYRWLRAGLGKMKMPVMAYMVVISVMMLAAFTLAGDRRYALGGRLLAFAGALAFVFSDIFVARQQFVAPAIRNHLIGLPLYYIAQFSLAFSISRL